MTSDMNKRLCHVTSQKELSPELAPTWGCYNLDLGLSANLGYKVQTLTDHLGQFVFESLTMFSSSPQRYILLFASTEAKLKL